MKTIEQWTAAEWLGDSENLDGTETNSELRELAQFNLEMAQDQGVSITGGVKALYNEFVSLRNDSLYD